MKILQLILSLMIIVGDLYDVSRADESAAPVLMKRPFCNAFTGCGKKRDSSYSAPAGGYNGFNDINNDYLQRTIPAYRVLLRIAAAARNNKNNAPLPTDIRQMMRPRPEALPRGIDVPF
ncbi:uncharacterized protein LOC106640602 [Copidosoma floridanum]|uniref:uncharacterized protein LOC106640602 n=1 Tax=Copidosoma floridanum TaxID=29053 RepID=UPI000C6F8D1B|nr:uncharacterized protein LOC106640602 [Copidosoma floridanum]